MNDLILIAAASFSLLLMVVYRAYKRQRSLKSALHSSRRLAAIAGLRFPPSSSVRDSMEKIVNTLAHTYNAEYVSLEFQSELFGSMSLLTGAAAKRHGGMFDLIASRLNELDLWLKGTVGESKLRDRKLIFVVNDRIFSSRLEIKTDLIPYQDEYSNMQEVLREKMSLPLYSKASGAGMTLLHTAETPFAILDGKGEFNYRSAVFVKCVDDAQEISIAELARNFGNADKESTILTSENERYQMVFSKIDSDLMIVSVRCNLAEAESPAIPAGPELVLQGLEDLNVGVVMLDKGKDEPDSEYGIASINRGFYRIFGLEGTTAHSAEVESILSNAVRPNEMKRLLVGDSNASGEFAYSRRDGLKVRTRVTLLRGSNGTGMVLFEPIENSSHFMRSYRLLLRATQNLIASGDRRAYLKELVDATRADGIALVRKTPVLGTLETTDKVGFIVNVPQLLLEDLPLRDYINSQGYLVIPLKDSKDEVSGALIALKPDQDSIEIVFTAARLLEAYNSIQEESRKLQFQNAKLLAEAKRADAATRSKSEFLANMSHEIRTPLNSVIGFADIIHSEADELTREMLADFSGNIVAAGKHLLSLINDILDLAKIETGRMKLDVQEFSLSDVVDSIRRILKPLLDKKNVVMEVEIENGLDVFTADTVKFKQILYNLLNNAITYSHERGRVALSIARSADGIEMKVTDEGVGIKKEDIDKLFKPFVQLGFRSGGTGLGLSLTKKFVELHGGAIWINSSFGLGTTVVVYLPGSPLSITTEEEISEEGKRDHIYVVTDDDELFGLFATVIDGIGFKLKKVSPQLMDDDVLFREGDGVLVVDASLENLNDGVISACKEAEKILMLTELTNVRAVTELMKDFESKVGFIDRRNFTKSELLAELNVAGRS